MARKHTQAAAEKKAKAEKVVDQKVDDVKAVAIPLQTALETVIENTDVGEVLALYDTGAEFNSEQIAADAAEFVLKGLVGSLCYNIVEGRKRGVKTLADAEDQMDAASLRDETFRTEKSADQLHQRIEWCAKMDVQQVYRASLQEFVVGLYTAITGERWATRAKNTGANGVDSPEQAVAAKLRARRAANRAAAE